MEKKPAKGCVRGLLPECQKIGGERCSKHTDFSSWLGCARGLPREHENQCKGVDQGCAALIKDLKQRGMLKDTLVIWGGNLAGQLIVRAN